MARNFLAYLVATQHKNDIHSSESNYYSVYRMEPDEREAAKITKSVQTRKRLHDSPIPLSSEVLLTNRSRQYLLSETSRRK